MGLFDLKTGKETKKSENKIKKLNLNRKVINEDIDSFIMPNDKLYKYISKLVIDRTTDKEIIFGTDSYDCDAREPMTEESVRVLLESRELSPRVYKSLQKQKARTKDKAEVFTPSWVCNEMINMCEPPKDWKKLVSSTWLEITCGEAPYITSNYDTVSGEDIEIDKRIGILDRKLSAINKNIDDKKEWTRWTKTAMKSVYGYEFQGDNLFIARVNVIRCFISFYVDKWGKQPDKKLLDEIVDIVLWNFWQMDGLKDVIPFTNNTYAKIRDWNVKSEDSILEFRYLKVNL